MSSLVRLLWTDAFDGRVSESGRHRVNTEALFDELLFGFGHAKRDARKGKQKLPCVRPGPVEKGEPFALSSKPGRPQVWYPAPPQVAILDIDNHDGGVTLADVEHWHAVLVADGLEHAIWETASSTPESPRVRVAAPLDKDVVRPGDRWYAQACKALAERAGIDPALLDTAGLRLGQVMALPAARNLDGRAPKTWYHDGGVLDPEVDDHVLVEEPRPATRTLDTMSSEEREFNERYGPDAEGLDGLTDRFAEQMGCRYLREGGHWRWESLDGTRAVQAGVFPSDEPGAYVDMYGTSPLSGRVVFALDFLVHQSALHEYGVDSLTDDEYKQARARYADPAKREVRQEQTARVLELAAQGPGTGGDGAAADRRPTLVEVAQQIAPRKVTKDGDEVVLIDKVTDSVYAPRLAPACRAVDRVRRSALGLPVIEEEDGRRKAVTGVEADRLRNRVFKELTPTDPALVPGRDLPSNPTMAFCDLIIGSRLESEPPLPDPRTALVDRCEEEWRASGAPGPRDLFKAPPGIDVSENAPEGVEYAWAVWERLWLLAAHRTLCPGSKYGSVLPFLTGGQGAGKNELAAAIAGDYADLDNPDSHFMVTDESFLDYGRNGSAAEAVVAASNRRVVLMDEVQGIGDGDLSSRRLKAFATTSTYSVTPKYVGTREVPRSFLLLAAANNAGRGLVPADEGYRRYMNVPLVDAAKGRSGTEHQRLAYQELSRIVSPAKGRNDGRYLTTMMTGWAAAQVREAVARGTEYELLDEPFDLEGWWWNDVLQGLIPVFGGRDVLADLVASEPVGGTHLLVRDVLGAGKATRKRREALEFWVRVVLGGYVDDSGEVATVDPARFEEWQGRLFTAKTLKLFREGGTV